MSFLSEWFVAYLLAAFCLHAARRQLTRLGVSQLVTPLWCWASLLALSFAFGPVGGYNFEAGSTVLMVSCAALFSLPAALLPVRSGRWYAVLAAVGWGLVLLADLPYQRFFGGIIPVSAAALTFQVSDLTDSLVTLVRGTDALLLLPAALSVLLFWRFSREFGGERPAAWSSGIRVVTAVVLFGAALPSMLQLREAVGNDAKEFKMYTTDRHVASWGVLNAHLFDWLKAAGERLAGDELLPEEREQLSHFLNQQSEREASQSSPWSGAYNGMNVVFLQLESFVGWVVGAEFSGQEITPFLNRLRETSLYYPNFHDQTMSGRTSDAEFVVLNSLHPLQSAVVAVQKANNDFVTLPSVLKAEGYTTFSAHAYERGFWNRAYIHPRYHFDQSLFRDEIGEGEQLGWGLADHVFLDRMASRLATTRQPFFSLLVTLSLHHPYNDFRPFRDLEIGELEGTIAGDYLRGVRYIDGVVESFFSDLAEQNLLANTIVVLYGDHDPGFRPDKREEAMIRGSSGRDKVPLFIVLPDVGPAPLDDTTAIEDVEGERTVGVQQAIGVQQTLGGHIDISPTVLDLLGLSAPVSFLGNSLLQPRLNPLVLQHGRVMSDQYARLAGGECVGMPLHRRVADVLCGPIDEYAAQEWEVSNLLVEHNLAVELSTFEFSAVELSSVLKN